MRFRILGSVGAVSGGREVILDGSKQRTVLAALLMARGRLITDQQLTTVLWESRPPTTANAQIYTYVSRLRKRLGDGIDIIRRRPGYLLRLGTATYDHLEFEELARAGRREAAAGRYEQALGNFRSALDLWQDPPLADVTDFFAESTRPQLEDERMTLLEDYVNVELRLGRHARVLPMLTELVAQHPLREGLRVYLMTALFRSGRQADALAAYAKGRSILADELGIDPGAELSAAFQAVLNGDLGRAVPVPRPRVPSSVWADLPPAMLPPDAADFVGRAAELAAINEILRTDRRRDPGAAGDVLLIHGAPGVGKTALALRAAHAAQHEFPDGQLYADLGGTTDTFTLLGSFLKALGLDEQSLPSRLDERLQLYRSRVADRRMLVLLENAADASQAGQLLPAGPGSRVLICGRADLTVAGAKVIEVGLLSCGEAHDMLSRIVGAGRVGAEPAAADYLVLRCGRLPLALRIVGARLAARPHWTLARMGGHLSYDGDLLDELEHGGLSVRAILQPCYAALDEPLRDAMERLARISKQEFSVWVAAAELGRSYGAALRVLEALCDARLLRAAADRDGSPCFGMHHLVRCFALEQAAARRRTELPAPAC